MRAAVEKVFGFVAYYLHLWPLVYRLLAWRQKKPLLTVFTFHRVLPGAPDDRFLQGYERGLPLAVHERQIGQIRRYFRVIDLETFSRLMDGDEPPAGKRPMALLTYDDADREHRLAFDHLIEHDLPAVSFVPTGFIGTERRFYHLRLTNVCNHLSNEQWAQILASDLPAEVREVLDRFAPDIAGSIRDVRFHLIDPFHEMDPTRRDALIAGWEREFAISYDLGIECLDWDGVVALPAQGIALGSHTVNHDRLTLIPGDVARSDLIESRETLEARSGQPVKTICYPEGSYDADTPGLCREAGYELGFTIETDFASYPVSGDDRFLIPRIGVGLGSNHAMAHSIGRLALKKLLRG